MLPRASALPALGWLVAACGGTTGPTPTERHDAEALRSILTHDQGTADSLQRADRMVDERRPVAAAHVIHGEAIPYAERTLRNIRELEIETARGRELQQKLVRAFRRRVRALGRYADVLATTEQDVALLDALHEHREAEDGLLAAWDEIDRVAGRPRAPPAKRR